MKEKRKKGTLVTIHQAGYFRPDIQVQQSLEYEAYTGDGCPVLYVSQAERVWGTRPWHQLFRRVKYAWRILKTGIGIDGDLTLNSKDCFVLGKKLIELGKWMEKNKWAGKKPKRWTCKDCGSRRIGVDSEGKQ